MPKSFLIRQLLDFDHDENVKSGVTGESAKDAIVTSMYGTDNMFIKPIHQTVGEPRLPIIISARSLQRDENFLGFSRKGSMLYYPSDIRCNCFQCIAVQHRRSLSPDSRPSTSSPGYNSSLDDSSCEVFMCVRCSTKFVTKSDLENHMRSHEKTYKCQICDRGFTWFGNFQKHMLGHGENESRLHPYFAYPNATEEELLIREGTNTFKCGLCQKTFTRMSGLRAHVRMHSGQRPFKCNNCSLAFTTNRALKMHMRIHSGERPYKCTDCTKTFTRKDELQAHIYLHKGEKPFKCEICSSAFVRHGHLQRHMLTHASEKPYKCKSCPKSFTQYRNLQTHMFKHTGERPYKCRYCGKGFTQYGTVQAHERTHTGTKPYPCNQCEKRFITSSHLRWHLKRHHSQNEAQTTTVEDEERRETGNM